MYLKLYDSLILSKIMKDDTIEKFAVRSTWRILDHSLNTLNDFLKSMEC